MMTRKRLVSGAVATVASALLAACSGPARDGSDAPRDRGLMPTAQTNESATTGGADIRAQRSFSIAPLVGKRGAPVDVRYRFEGSVEPNKATGLVVEVKPRIVADKMTIEMKAPPGVRVDDAIEPAIQKALPSQTYRKNVSVTPLQAGVDEMQVMVTMESPEGLVFGIYRISMKQGTGDKKGQKRPRQ